MAKSIKQQVKLPFELLSTLTQFLILSLKIHTYLITQA